MLPPNPLSKEALGQIHDSSWGMFQLAMMLYWPWRSDGNVENESGMMTEIVRKAMMMNGFIKKLRYFLSDLGYIKIFFEINFWELIFGFWC